MRQTGFFCFSKEMNESRDLDSYKIRFLNGLLTRIFSHDGGGRDGALRRPRAVQARN